MNTRIIFDKQKKNPSHFERIRKIFINILFTLFCYVYLRIDIMIMIVTNSELVHIMENRCSDLFISLLHDYIIFFFFD